MQSGVHAIDRQERMIQSQIIERGITEPRLLAALRAIPRAAFFPNALGRAAYADAPAEIGFGQTISQPYIVALMTHRLQIDATHCVLEVGTGSGYQTAVLAKLAREVWTVERIKPLLDAAWERIMGLGLRNVHFRHGDGLNAMAEPGPFDRILVAAAPREIPTQFLLKNLKVGGAAVLPVGSGKQQLLMHITRGREKLRSVEICPCRFVPLIESPSNSDANTH